MQIQVLMSMGNCFVKFYGFEVFNNFRDFKYSLNLFIKTIHLVDDFMILFLGIQNLARHNMTLQQNLLFLLCRIIPIVISFVGTEFGNTGINCE